MEKIKKSQISASRKKSQNVKLYITNWKDIKKLCSLNPRMMGLRESVLKGLQTLNREEDVVYFEEWGEQTNPYTANAQLNVSWIWNVAMQSKTAICNDKSSVESLTRSWEREGMNLLEGKLIMMGIVVSSSTTSLVASLFQKRALERRNTTYP
jgi:hypothetical protein